MPKKAAEELINLDVHLTLLSSASAALCRSLAMVFVSDKFMFLKYLRSAVNTKGNIRTEKYIFFTSDIATLDDT